MIKSKSKKILILLCFHLSLSYVIIFLSLDSLMLSFLLLLLSGIMLPSCLLKKDKSRFFMKNIVNSSVLAITTVLTLVAYDYVDSRAAWFDLMVYTASALTAFLICFISGMILGRIALIKKLIVENKVIALFTFAILVITVVNYKQIPGYHGYLKSNSLLVECKGDVEKKEIIPCKNYFDCTREAISEYCPSGKYSLGTRCDYMCSIKTFCLDGYCRTDSYIGALVAW